MKRSEKVLELSKKIVRWLKLYSKRIEIVGSIRRHERNPRDVDIVLIPKSLEALENFMRSKGKFLQGGEKKSRWRIEGVKVELYYAEKAYFGAMLLAYSSRRGSGIGLRLVAKRKGFKLNQYGLFRKGKRVAGQTEREIYSALGRTWKNPEDR